VALRKVQFPNAADVLDPSALAAMDEAKLAALETRLGAPARGAAPAAVIDPNAPTRTVPTAQAAGAPKSTEQLKDLLKAQEGEYIASLER
jgi:hypothetical protein